MTQRDIDQLTALLNEVNTKLILSKDKIDTQERIIKAQEEMIEILKSNVQNRDKIIDALETQVALLEKLQQES
jgi:hypothetical protein